MAAAEAAGGDSWAQWQARWYAAVRICGWDSMPGPLPLEQWGGQYVFLQLLPVARALLRCVRSRGFGSGGKGSAGYAAGIACAALARMACDSFKEWWQGGASPPQLLAAHLEAAAVSTAGLHSLLAAWEAEGCTGASPAKVVEDVFLLPPLIEAAAKDEPLPGGGLAADAALAAADAAIRLAAALLQQGQRQQQHQPAGCLRPYKVLATILTFVLALFEAASGCPPTPARERAAHSIAISTAKLCLIVAGLPASQHPLVSASCDHKLKRGLSILQTHATSLAVAYGVIAGSDERGPAAAAAGGERGPSAAAASGAGIR